jgi:zinc/manganese transport system permease protein
MNGTQGFLDIMAAPFAASLLLVGIHAALGRHVLARGVVFVDLALAQIAGLGGAVALLAGAQPHSAHSYLLAFSFTLMGALLFSFLWDRRKPVLQEAFIGIAFATAGALTALLLSNAPHGSEQLTAMFAGGGLLWLSWGEIGVMAALYSAVGAFLFWGERRLWACSSDTNLAAKRGVNARLWDFLFYTAFGLVVTSSVRAAGVLAVFAFLIMPNIAAKLLGKGGRGELVWSWGLGVAGALIAMALAYFQDWPTGATLVAVYGVGVFLFSILFRGQQRKG